MPQILLKAYPVGRKTTTALLVLSLFIGLFYSINLPLFDVDEGAFSEASREMLVSGNYISPRLDNVPRFDKPVLIYWLQTASMKVFGVNEFAARLPAVLATCFWAFLLIQFMKTLGYKEAGLFAAIILASCLEIAIIGKAATADTLLNLFLACSQCCFFLHFQRRQHRYIYLAFLFMGLGFLTKGPVAVLLPAATTFLFALLSPSLNLKHWLKTMFNPIAIVIFVMIALPWYIAEYLRDGMDFINGFFLKHNLGRFSQAMETHHGSWWYYLPIILVGLFPFSAYLIPIFQRWHSVSTDPLRLFMLLWFGFVLILFTLSSTKLPHYIVYGFTPLFILIAIEAEKSQSTLKSWAFIPAIMAFILLLGLPEILIQSASNLSNPAVRNTYLTLTSHIPSSYLWFQGLCLCMAIIPIIYSKTRRLFTLFLCAIMLSWSVNHYLLPAVAAVQQQPIKEAALLAKKNHWDVTHWRIKAPSFSFYRQAPSLHKIPSSGNIVLTKSAFLSDFKKYAILYKNTGIVLIRLQ